MVASLKAITPKRTGLQRTEALRENSRRAMQEYLKIIAYDLSHYPPQKGHRYVRTNRLHEGWLAPDAIEVSSDGAQGTLVNRTPYAVYAQGPRGSGRGRGERQTRLMRSLGWQSITDVAKKHRPFFPGKMNRAYGPAPGSVEDL